MKDHSLEYLVNRLNHLATKKDGWKGPNSIAMPEELHNQATAFLFNNFPNGCPSLFIGLDEDGSITLFVKRENVIMDFSIDTNHTCSYYAVIDDVRYEANERPLTDKIEVLEHLLRVMA